jgi:hypothetical protein
MELGVTGTHVIKIPARPWLKPGVQSGTLDYLDTISNGIKNGVPMDTVLNQVGVVAVGRVQKYMTELKTPPNAASTIKKKSSSNPLIDSGALRQSVTYTLSDAPPTEGI